MIPEGSHRRTTRWTWTGAGVTAALLIVLASCAPESTVIPVTTVPDTVVLSPEALSLQVGDTATVSATAFTILGYPASADIVWESASPSVAAISANGLVTAVGAGATQLFAISTQTLSWLTVVVAEPPES
jgi:hypothetical protein